MQLWKQMFFYYKLHFDDIAVKLHKDQNEADMHLVLSNFCLQWLVSGSESMESRLQDRGKGPPRRALYSLCLLFLCNWSHSTSMAECFKAPRFLFFFMAAPFHQVAIFYMYCAWFYTDFPKTEPDMFGIFQKFRIATRLNGFQKCNMKTSVWRSLLIAESMHSVTRKAEMQTQQTILWGLQKY